MTEMWMIYVVVALTLVLAIRAVAVFRDKTVGTLFQDSWKYLRSYFRKRPGCGHYLRERYGLDEKPEGWNDAVLGHFHNGPELRQPGSEFHEAFQERAKVPPPLWTANPRPRRRIDLRAARFPWLFPASKS